MKANRYMPLWGIASLAVGSQTSGYWADALAPSVADCFVETGPRLPRHRPGGCRSHRRWRKARSSGRAA